MLTEADLVVVMDREQGATVGRLRGKSGQKLILLGDLDPGRIDTRTVFDPNDHPQDVFERVFSRIDRCVMGLASALVAGDPAREVGRREEGGDRAGRP